MVLSICFTLGLNSCVGSKTLHEAAEAQDLSAVKKLLASGANPNERAGDENWTPLMWACLKNDVPIATTLIAAGADLEIKNNSLATALNIAVAHSRTEISILLIRKKANVNHGDARRWTPVMWASFNGDLAIVKALTENGAKLNRRNFDKHTALMWAAMKGYKDVAAYLLSKGAKINLRGKQKKSILTMAAEKNQTEMIEFLKSEGAR